MRRAASRSRWPGLNAVDTIHRIGNSVTSATSTPSAFSPARRAARDLSLILIAAWRPRPSGGEETPLPPSVRWLIQDGRALLRLVHADGLQVPGLPGSRTGERAEPHVRLRPRRVEPDPRLAARPVPRRAGQDGLRPGQRLPDRHEGHRRPRLAQRGVLRPLQQAIRHQQVAFSNFFA